MDKQDLKKLLAGLAVASLIAGAGLTMGGCATTSCSAAEKPAASGCSGADQPAGGSGCSGAEKPAGGSGCSGSK